MVRAAKHYFKQKHKLYVKNVLALNIMESKHETYCDSVSKPIVISSNNKNLIEKLPIYEEILESKNEASSS